MNILFVSISSMAHMSTHSISLDLIREIKKHGHNVYVICAIEKKDDRETQLTIEEDCYVLRVKIGNNKKVNLIEKGLTNIMLPNIYIKAIKEFFSNVKFDLVLYPTPPVTQAKTVKYIKKRDGAKSYLLLRDIFPQNAIDIGVMSTSGIKGLIYRYFRKCEKALYRISDKIGCTSQANIDFILTHNPEISSERLEMCPNCIEVQDVLISEREKVQMRQKYGIPLDKKVFVYGGNLGKPQDIPFVIKCLDSQEKNLDAYFLIVGDGTEYKKLEKYIQENSPTNVRLMKKLPREDYEKMVAACDIGMIFLDHRFTVPNCPSRLLSYMQAKLPVLACTDTGTDIGKIIEDGEFGVWCESNRVEGFDKAVKRILSSEIEKMGENGYQYLLDNYTVQKQYNQISLLQ